MLFKCENCGGMVDSAGCDYGEEIICGHCEETATVPSSMFSTNAIIDDFVVEKFLGKGGMGMVYRAHQISLDRTVALKILTPSEDMGAEAVDDFVREARSAASLNHPHIVQAYAVGKYEDIYYFGMEYVEGQTVKELMDKEPILDEDSTLAIGLNIAEALREAWDRKKIIHRDIKPDNIMLTDEGVVKLMDLGLCCTHTESANESDTITGTPQYICPEQIMGTEMDIRGDLYSLGATMYHMMTGEFCFNGSGYNEILRGHLERDAKPLTEFGRNISQGTWEVIKKLLEKDPKDRYQTAQDLIQAIQDARAGKAGLPETLTSKAMKKPSLIPPSPLSPPSDPDKVSFSPKKNLMKSKKFMIMGAVLAVLIILRIVVSLSSEDPEVVRKKHLEEQVQLAKKNEEARKVKDQQAKEAETKALDTKKAKRAEKKKLEEQEAARKAAEAKKAAEAAKQAALAKPANPNVDIISKSFLWSYNYTASPVASNWMKPDFNDSLWKKGNAPIGYGTTKPAAKTQLQRTKRGLGILYVRRKFVLKEVNKDLEYRIAFMVDDGAGAWVNGSRVAVYNIDTKNLNPKGLAKSENKDTALKFKGWAPIPHNKLKAGLNVIAIEVHPASSRTPDLFFDMKLTSRPKGINKKKKSGNKSKQR